MSMKKTSLFFVVLLFVSSFLLKAENPIIGISGYVDGSTNVANNTYLNAVRLAGGVPIIIPVTSDDDQIAAILGVIDGLVMTGGEDFDPLKWYNEEPIRSLGSVAPERDEFDVKLVRAAVAKGIPVLGVCRGMQLINIAFGGSLYQDIPSQVKESFVKHRQQAPGNYGTHTIFVDENSLLFQQIGVQNVVVNSFHHQAVKGVAQGFKVTAKSADNIAEAMEKSGKINFPDGGAVIMGVQFHPEIFTSAGDKTFLGIFKYLVKEASK